MTLSLTAAYRVRVSQSEKIILALDLAGLTERVLTRFEGGEGLSQA